MSIKEDRFSMSAQKYLSKHHVIIYLEDAMSQLLIHREENPKVEPLKFLSQYFNRLRNGSHTMLREFAFIRSTPHNRASFVWLFWKCFRQIGKKGDLLSIQEYHSLLGLLCTDFPFQLVQKTARIVLIDDALDCLISFSDFIYAFQVQFCYEEFLDECGELYKSLMQSTYNPLDPVIVPTSSGQGIKGVHHNQHMPVDGLDATQFFRAVCTLCDRVDYSTPPVACLKEILFSTSRISFYGFLMSIAKSEAINEHLGRLPPKAELLEGADLDMASPPMKIATPNSGRSSVLLGSSAQRTVSNGTVKPALTKMESVNMISHGVRNKLSEHVQRIRSSKQTRVESSDSGDTSTDTSDSVSLMRAATPTGGWIHASLGSSMQRTVPDDEIYPNLTQKKSATISRMVHRRRSKQQFRTRKQPHVETSESDNTSTDFSDSV